MCIAYLEYVIEEAQTELKWLSLRPGQKFRKELLC